MQSPLEEIPLIISEMEADTRAIEEQITELVWYMRGGLGYTEAWGLSLKQINIIQKQIKKNIEFVKKTGLPIL